MIWHILFHSQVTAGIGLLIKVASWILAFILSGFDKLDKPIAAVIPIQGQ
jgi:hypothetical protein